MLKYNVQGKMNGEIIIFINGAGIGTWMWDEQVKYFKKNYKCITFDLPGHGSNNKIEFTSIATCAEQLKEIILKEYNSGEKVTLVGHSIGAQVVMYMLKNDKWLVKNAVIISGLNKPMPFMNRFIKPIVNCTMPLSKNRRFAKNQARAISIPRRSFNDYYNHSLTISKQSMINIMRDNSNFEFNDSSIYLDALVLVGEKEKKIMKVSAERTHKLLSNSIGFIVRGAGHGIPYEKSELLSKLIEDLIKKQKIDEEGLIPLTD